MTVWPSVVVLTTCPETLSASHRYSEPPSFHTLVLVLACAYRILSPPTTILPRAGCARAAAGVSSKRRPAPTPMLPATALPRRSGVPRAARRWGALPDSTQRAQKWLETGQIEGHRRTDRIPGRHLLSSKSSSFALWGCAGTALVGTAIGRTRRKSRPTRVGGARSGPRPFGIRGRTAPGNLALRRMGGESWSSLPEIKVSR